MIEDRKIHTSDKNKIIAAVRLDRERFGELLDILGDNYTVRELNSEDEALALLDSALEQVLAVLFNAEMTEDEGFGLLRRIDDNKLFVEIPVIGVSDGRRDELRTRCIDAGVNEFFEPPFRSEMIPIRVKNAAAQRIRLLSGKWKICCVSCRRTSTSRISTETMCSSPTTGIICIRQVSRAGRYAGKAI